MLWLDVSDINLNTLDVSNKIALSGLDVSNNNLNTLDVTNNTALNSLDVSNNNLNILDVSNNTTLQWLYVSNNNLNTLDVTNNTVLSGLDVSNNNLSILDVSNNTAMEMQQAIRALASQGIISGMTPTEYAPDDPLTRAQTATLITNILNISDIEADFKFIDVNRSDWFFIPVNTIRRHNIMHGTSPNIFELEINIPKIQMTAITARILRTEMRYYNPQNPMLYLRVFTDAEDLPEWSILDISLAARENLIIRREDGYFMPVQAITRGEAAIILHRLYGKLW